MSYDKICLLLLMVLGLVHVLLCSTLLLSVISSLVIILMGKSWLLYLNLVAVSVL